MDIICHNCHSKFKISDKKLPAGKTASFPCPKCKSKITLGADKRAAKGGNSAATGENGDGYDVFDKPFDFIEEEGLTALVCEQNPLVRKTITDALELMEYQITAAESARDALKRMRYHVYDLIVVNESLERLSMATRRNMFVAMVSDRFRTMDNMMSLNKSVNLIINVKNVDDIGKILSRGITDNEYFYRVFKESLKETGKV
jgi:predicted Zn finger-like uncharacterized protein